MRECVRVSVGRCERERDCVPTVAVPSSLSVARERLRVFVGGRVTDSVVDEHCEPPATVALVIGRSNTAASALNLLSAKDDGSTCTTLLHGGPMMSCRSDDSAVALALERPTA